MNRILTITTLVIEVGLAAALALVMAQSSASQPDHHEPQAQTDQTPMPSCPMMTKRMMHNMPMGNMMRHMGSMHGPMMKEHSMMTGQCMQMMMSDEDHSAAMIEMLKQNPQLREQMKQMLKEAEQ